MISPALTRTDALIVWRKFLPKIEAYAGSRNHVSDGHTNVSCLSPSIRFRLLLEDEIISETLANFSFSVAEKWLQEVCWHRYWKGWLEMRPQVWNKWRRQVRSLRQKLPDERSARATAVMAGQSGVGCMDRIARELIETGYLHNHARMWWASFWIHVERLPWELGADFFFRHLLDADPASNTLSWRWVAGLQTPGKTYLVRLSNIQKYAPSYLNGNTTGHERLTDEAITAAKVVETADLTRRPTPKYPTTFNQTEQRTGLWLHPDDLLPEVGPLANLAPVTIAACISDDIYKDNYRLSSLRISSLHTVLHDGLTRTATHYACPAINLGPNDPVHLLCSWAQEHNLLEVVALAPMVGPIHDLLPQLSTKLESIGIRLTLVRRASDESAFSMATAGFFPFWQKMSSELNSRYSK